MQGQLDFELKLVTSSPAIAVRLELLGTSSELTSHPFGVI